MSEVSTAKKQLGKVAVQNHEPAQPVESTRSKLKLPGRFKPQKRDAALVLAGAVLMFTILSIHLLTERAKVPLRPQTTGIDSPWIPSTVKHWDSLIETQAKKYNIDPTFLAIIMTLESGGNPKADSGQATGLMQITPATGKDIAHKYLKQPVDSYDLYDPATSIEFGAAYLSYLRDTFGDYTQSPSYDLTAEAVGSGYNGGPGAAADTLAGKGVKNEQTVLYSRNVFYFWRERHASSSPAYLRWRDEAGGIRLLQAAAKNQ